MQQTTKRFASMIIVLVFIVGAFVVFFEFIRPAYDDAQQVRSEVISREQFVTDQQEAIQQVQQLIASYQSQATVQDSVTKALPNAPDFAGALYQLNGIASGSGVGLQSLTVSAPTLSTSKPTPGVSSDPTALVRPIGALTFQVKYAGRYEDVKTFLQNIENNVRLFDVQSINVQPAGTKGVTDFFTVDMSVVTYYQVQ